MSQRDTCDAGAPEPPGGPVAATASALPGPPSYRHFGREVVNPKGAFWLIERPLAAVDPVLSLDGLEALCDRRTVFFDLETCGLMNSMIFLVGEVSFAADGPLLRQYWARNYAEEASLLFAFHETLQQTERLVSFNGKSFDWPQIKDRGWIHSVRFDPLESRWEHCDLLHAARRLWKSSLPDCRLQTLERRICQRFRTGDLPSHLVPEAYHDYVRSGNDSLVAQILHHNAIDLVTMVDLGLRLSNPTA